MRKKLSFYPPSLKSTGHPMNKAKTILTLVDRRNKLMAEWKANRQVRGKIEMELDRLTCCATDRFGAFVVRRRRHV